jgi:hypothetical protein
MPQPSQIITLRIRGTSRARLFVRRRACAKACRVRQACVKPEEGSTV